MPGKEKMGVLRFFQQIVGIANLFTALAGFDFIDCRIGSVFIGKF